MHHAGTNGRKDVECKLVEKKNRTKTGETIRLRGDRVSTGKEIRAEETERQDEEKKIRWVTRARIRRRARPFGPDPNNIIFTMIKKNFAGINETRLFCRRRCPIKLCKCVHPTALHVCVYTCRKNKKPR